MGKPHWSLDRRVPVAIIVAIFLQSGVGIWWAATFTAETNSRLHALEKSQRTTDEAKLGERMVRLEVLFQQVVDSTARIERQLQSRK